MLAIKFYGLGNIAMLLPVLQAVHDSLPEIEIDFLTLQENRSLLERSGLVRKVLTADLTTLHGFVGGLWRALRQARARRYDLVADFEQFIKLSAIFSYCTGAPDRIGFNTDGQHRAWLYNVRVVYTDSEHMSGIFKRILRPLQIPLASRPVRMAVVPEEERRIDSLLDENGISADRFPLIAVHVGSGPNFYHVPLKRWPVQNFARLCDALIERYGATIVLTGKGAEERALVAETKAAMKATPVDLCDRVSVEDLMVLLRRCHLTVANDTSVMHLAALVGTPVVAFFGPTLPIHYGPGNAHDLVFYRDLYCSPCLTNYNLKVSRCTDPVCIRTISVEEVFDGIEKRFLAEDAPLRPHLKARAPDPAGSLAAS
jgi:ADP-heptose:LPS heptosyltransferase